MTILGPPNLPSEVPHHASQMYAKNISTFLLNLVKDKQVQINLDDEIIRDTLIARDGQVVNPRIQAIARHGQSRCLRRATSQHEASRRCVSRTLRRKDKSNHVA